MSCVPGINPEVRSLERAFTIRILSGLMGRNISVRYYLPMLSVTLKRGYMDSARCCMEVAGRICPRLSSAASTVSRCIFPAVSAVG